MYGQYMNRLGYPSQPVDAASAALLAAAIGKNNQVLADPHVRAAYLGEEDELLTDPDEPPLVEATS